jgi:hypothetical protein
MIIGFTGTQDGMTEKQRAALKRLLEQLDVSVFRHGDCVGADTEAHELVRAALPSCRIYVHPPTDEKLRSFCKGDLELKAKKYLDRNRDIVDGCELLIAASKTEKEVLRSGTWSTIRYARKQKVPIKIIYPSGYVGA